MDVTAIKQRFEIIGNSPLLDRALDIAAQVAATDLSVLVTGETGVGKEFIPKIIHTQSIRKQLTKTEWGILKWQTKAHFFLTR